MKTSQILCVVLAAALAFTAWQSWSGRSADGSERSADGNVAYDCIMTRTSCRSFADRELTDGQIDSLLRAGMASPTARNQQPWQFVVVTERALLDSIAAECANIKMAAEAPAAIVVCGDLTIARDKAEEFWPQDLAAVSENILLAANSMGLGAVWCGIYPIDERVKFIGGLLGLPAEVIPLSVIPVGVPATKLTPKDKYDARRVHRNAY